MLAQEWEEKAGKCCQTAPTTTGPVCSRAVTAPSFPPRAPARPLCLSTKCLLTHSHGTMAEDLVKGGRRANGPTVHGTGQGITAPKQGRKLSVTPQMRQRQSGLRKLGGKGKRKCLAKAEALLPDGPTGFESGTKLQRCQRPILETASTQGRRGEKERHDPQPLSWSTKTHVASLPEMGWGWGGGGAQSEPETRSLPEGHVTGLGIHPKSNGCCRWAVRRKLTLSGAHF